MGDFSEFDFPDFEVMEEWLRQNKEQNQGAMESLWLPILEPEYRDRGPATDEKRPIVISLI
jgi:hypothetical protein